MPKPFTTVVADPGWQFKDKLRMSRVKRSAGDHYRTDPTREICMFHMPYPLARDGFLFLWVTNTHLLNGSGWRVCEAWGYTPKQLITWVKGASCLRTYYRITSNTSSHGRYAYLKYQIGMGHFTRNVTEHMILATRGHAKHLIQVRNLPNHFVAPLQRRRKTGRKHSVKPKEAYELIQRLVPGPYLELFAREPRHGWTVWGNEVKS
jgi:N6-adenosine-specific RNA methylase IME4